MRNIKVLSLASNPNNTNQLALDEEIREIKSKIGASGYRDSIDLESSWAVRPDDLLQMLNQHMPQIVHFSGHGSGSGEIILTSVNGEPKPVSSKALKALFTTLKDNIKVVVLNCCYSKEQAKVITQVIDCAVGMSEAIGDKAAIIFAASFYRAIGFGRSVKDAFDQGITALLLEGIPEENTPELLVKDGVDPSNVVLLGSPDYINRAPAPEDSFIQREEEEKAKRDQEEEKIKNKEKDTFDRKQLEEQFNFSLKSDPNNVDPLSRKQLEEQSNFWLKLDPNNVDPLSKYLNLLSQIGSEEAIEQFKLETERNKEAEEQFKLSLKFDLNNASTHYNYGFLLSKMGRNEEAGEQYKLSLKLDPDNPLTHCAYGLLLSKMGRNEEAQKHYDICYGGPNSPSVKNAKILADIASENLSAQKRLFDEWDKCIGAEKFEERTRKLQKR